MIRLWLLLIVTAAVSVEVCVGGKMIRAYRIFAVKKRIQWFAVLELLVAAMAVVAWYVKGKTYSGWLFDFIDDVVPLIIAVLFSVVPILMLTSLFDANFRDKPGGYKYFHSLGESARLFHSAILFVNVTAFVLIMCFTGIMWELFDHQTVRYTLRFELLAIGTVNFFGFSRFLLARVVPYLILAFSVGLCGVTFMWRDTAFGGEMFTAVFGVAALGVYSFGLFHAFTRAQSAWERGSEK